MCFGKETHLDEKAFKDRKAQETKTRSMATKSRASLMSVVILVVNLVRSFV